MLDILLILSMLLGAVLGAPVVQREPVADGPWNTGKVDDVTANGNPWHNRSLPARDGSRNTDDVTVTGGGNPWHGRSLPARDGPRNIDDVTVTGGGNVWHGRSLPVLDPPPNIDDVADTAGHSWHKR